MFISKVQDMTRKLTLYGNSKIKSSIAEIDKMLIYILSYLSITFTIQYNHQPLNFLAKLPVSKQKKLIRLLYVKCTKIMHKKKHYTTYYVFILTCINKICPPNYHINNTCKTSDNKHNCFPIFFCVNNFYRLI